MPGTLSSLTQRMEVTMVKSSQIKEHMAVKGSERQTRRYSDRCRR